MVVRWPFGSIVFEFDTTKVVFTYRNQRSKSKMRDFKRFLQNAKQPKIPYVKTNLLIAVIRFVIPRRDWLSTPPAKFKPDTTKPERASRNLKSLMTHIKPIFSTRVLLINVFFRIKNPCRKSLSGFVYLTLVLPPELSIVKPAQVESGDRCEKTVLIMVVIKNKS